MKNIIFKIGMIVIGLVSSLSGSAYDFEVDGIAYNILSAGDLTCEVTVGESKYAGEVVIPSTVKFQNKELSVVKVGDKCFEKCTDLTSVQIPSSVTSLGNNSFAGCTGLTSVQIPSSVEYIGSFCFSGCTGLTSVEIPSSVEKIESFCFSGCTGLTSVQIPSSVTKLGSSSFSGCTGLTSVEIPSSVEDIGGFCFSDCTGLTSVEIPSTVGRIDDRCFSGCTGLTSVRVYCYRIGELCFEKCTNLSSVYCNATKIGEGAFKGTGILDLTIGELVEFEGIKSLNVTFTDGIKKLVFEDRDTEIEDNDESSDWKLNELEYLYLGVSVGPLGLRCYESLKELVLGPRVDKLGMGIYFYNTEYNNIGSYSNLISLKSLNQIPPSIGKPTNLQYVNIEVTVPEEALEAYKADPVWGSFWNLKGVSGTQTVSSTSEREVTGYYDLSGRQVDESFSGMVIVRFSDGSAKKMMRR